MSKKNTILVLGGYVVLITAMLFIKTTYFPYVAPQPTPTPDPKTVVGTNDWIISESKKCTDAGMYPAQVINIYFNKITKIICQPKDKR